MFEALRWYRGTPLAIVQPFGLEAQIATDLIDVLANVQIVCPDSDVS